MQPMRHGVAYFAPRTHRMHATLRVYPALGISDQMSDMGISPCHIACARALVKSKATRITVEESRGASCRDTIHH